MSSDGVSDSLPAGEFTGWLRDMKRAVRGEIDADVPCDGCTACCRSSHFVHIDPDEVDVLAHIEPALLFPAPGLPDGHMIMGYDKRGHCPMLVDDLCTIYEHRPRACRNYDCRLYAATDVDPSEGDERRVEIARRVSRWQFSYDDPVSELAHAELKAAAAAITDALSPTERAVRALAVEE